MTTTSTKKNRKVDTDWILWALAAIATAAALLPVVGNALVWDDEYLILGAEGLGDPDRLGRMLTVPFWHNSDYLLGEPEDYWRPLTTLVLWLGGLLFGEWAAGYHALSLLGALFAAAGLAALARRVAGPRHIAWRYAALVFIAHPLAAEIVCQTANLSDHLVLGFTCFTTLAILRALEDRSGRLRALAVASALAAGACAAKELGLVVVLAPLFAFLLRRNEDDSFPLTRLAAPGPLFAVALPAAGYLVGRHLVTSAAGHSAIDPPSLLVYARALFFGGGQCLATILAPFPRGTSAIVRSTDPIAIAWGVVALTGIATLADRKSVV